VVAARSCRLPARCRHTITCTLISLLARGLRLECRDSLLLNSRVVRVIQVVQVGHSLDRAPVRVLDDLKLLLKVLLAHYIVVPAQRLDYLLPVLVDSDGF